jgi:hypothetical protein
MTHSIGSGSRALFLATALLAAAPALAGDVSVQLDAGAGFSVKNSTGATERLRVDEATGNVSRNGALFVHTTGASNNTFVGVNAGNTSTTGIGGNTAFGTSALRFNTTGTFNSAVGVDALRSNTGGNSNSAFGSSALQNNKLGTHNSAFGNSALQGNTYGQGNAAVGNFALRLNTTGDNNSALGMNALASNTTGFGNSAVGNYALRDNTTGTTNSAFGDLALASNVSGNRNIAVGMLAGGNLSAGNDNIYLAHQGMAAESGRIRIGLGATHIATFIAGIRGATTANANAIPVLIDSDGQLGTVSSSRSVKKEIRDMGDATARLLDLRPVTFRYKQEQTLPSGGEVPPEYGLIAEEVAEVFPDLVVYDEKGQPFTVKYHEMAPMLLNEMKKQQDTIARLEARIARFEQRSPEGDQR